MEQVLVLLRCTIFTYVHGHKRSKTLNVYTGVDQEYSISGFLHYSADTGSGYE